MKIALAIIIFFLGPGMKIFSQPAGFNLQIYPERSILLRNILVDHDTLIITGEVGPTDQFLQGYFAMLMDTFGNILDYNTFQDTAGIDIAFLDGDDPVILHQNSNIIMAGHYHASNDQPKMVASIRFVRSPQLKIL